MDNHIHIGINQNLQGFYKVGTVNPLTNEIKWQSEDFRKNLILNQGMDHIYNASIVDQMLYGICGVGTRPNNFGSGTSKISQGGTTVTLVDTSGDIIDFTSSVNAYPTLVQSGDMIIYANNSQSSVTSVTDGFHLQVSPSYTFSNLTFTVWKTTQVGLQSEVSRSTSYLGGAGNCGTTIINNIATHLRSYEFPIQSSQTSYNELGIGWATLGPATVFSRILLDSPITVDAGWKLRLVYSLLTSYWPTSSIYGDASVGGWPVAPSTNTTGTQSIQKFLISTVNTSDGISNNTNAVLDPYYVVVGGRYFSLWASSNSSSLVSFDSAVNRTGGTFAAAESVQASKASYVAGSYTCDRISAITAGALSSNNLRSVGFGVGGTGGSPGDSNYQAFCFLFNQPQTIYNTQTLSITFREQWDRVLS